MDVNDIKTLGHAVTEQVGRAIIGQHDTIELLLIALFAKGHILLEGAPGVGKTYLAHCFSRTISLQMGRIQFTPDLMPGDILGSNIFNFQTSQFSLTKGPIFNDLILGDEINRTPPKTQSALLEAMQERQVTLDGVTHPLSPFFMVVATQNPLEQHGTYPLPEAQADRFLFKHILSYPTAQQEYDIVLSHGQAHDATAQRQHSITPVIHQNDLARVMQTISQIHIAPDVVKYLVDLVRATRQSPDLDSGASPRAAVMLATAARARAGLQGRDYVIPDDIKTLALPALRHRIMVSPAAMLEGRRSDDIVRELLVRVATPR